MEKDMLGREQPWLDRDGRLQCSRTGMQTEMYTQ